MDKFSVLDWIAMILVIIGGLNWGLVGVLGLDFVATIFGGDSLIARVIYILVGLAAIYVLINAAKMGKKAGEAPTV